MRRWRRAAWLGALLGLGCSDGSEFSQALCVSVDISGTYVDQLDEVAQTLRSSVLPGMLPGDSLVLVRIDSESYEKDNVVGKMTLDLRPSHANAQKLNFANLLNEFAGAKERSQYTDIPGAMMLCADHLKETAAGSRSILVFSDMQEELPAQVKRELAEDEFSGIHVAAINVKRLQGDNVDPEGYRQRLREWDSRVTGSGAAAWKVIVDPAQLSSYLETIRN